MRLSTTRWNLLGKDYGKKVMPRLQRIWFYGGFIMGDLISRQAALDAVFNNAEHPDKAYQAIRNLPTAQPGWIPTSERLPDVRQWVLCQCRAGIMDVLRLTADGSWSKNYPHTEYMSSFVVAWMPLPKPWEGGQDDV